MTPERARKIAKDCADSWYGGASGLSLKEAITRGILEACQETEGDLVATRAERDYYRQDLAAARTRVAELTEERDTLAEELAAQREAKDGAYLERNRLVALLASLFPSGIARTAIDGWSEDWHGCVYIDFPWGQASWHFHDSQSYLFGHLPPYRGKWDGHTTEQKYAAIDAVLAKEHT